MECLVIPSASFFFWRGGGFIYSQTYSKASLVLLYSDESLLFFLSFFDSFECFPWKAKCFDIRPCEVCFKYVCVCVCVCVRVCVFVFLKRRPTLVVVSPTFGWVIVASGCPLSSVIDRITSKLFLGLEWPNSSPVRWSHRPACFCFKPATPTWCYGRVFKRKKNQNKINFCPLFFSSFFF